jgi:hypothetical protein
MRTQDLGTQCTSCGRAEVVEELALELDDEAIARTTPRGVGGDRPTDAQIGATVATREPSAEVDTAAVARAARVTAAPTEGWADRERGRQLLLRRVTRAPIVAILALFTMSALLLDSHWLFVDYVNLALHEGGHLLLRWAGLTVHIMGGTLAQLALPIACAAYFWRWRGDRFAALVCAWWVAENLVMISHYLRDAPTMALPLVGGEIHDWNYLLTRWRLLRRAHGIADLLIYGGGVAMIACLGTLLWWTLRPPDYESAYDDDGR